MRTVVTICFNRKSAVSDHLFLNTNVNLILNIWNDIQKKNWEGIHSLALFIFFLKNP